MKKLFIFSALLTVTTMAEAQDKLYSDEFPIGDVTLLNGPLKEARDLNIKVAV